MVGSVNVSGSKTCTPSITPHCFQDPWSVHWYVSANTLHQWPCSWWSPLAWVLVPALYLGLHILISSWMTSMSLHLSNSRVSPFMLDADVPRICTKEAWLLGVLFWVVNGILFLGALCCTCLHQRSPASFQPTHPASQHLLQFNLKSLTYYYPEGLGVAWKREVFTSLTFYFF